MNATSRDVAATSDQFERGYSDGQDDFGMFCAEPDGGWVDGPPDWETPNYRAGWQLAVDERFAAIENPPEPRDRDRDREDQS